jgi:hypothetical protein
MCSFYTGSFIVKVSSQCFLTCLFYTKRFFQKKNHCSVFSPTCSTRSQ